MINKKGNLDLLLIILYIYLFGMFLVIAYGFFNGSEQICKNEHPNLELECDFGGKLLECALFCDGDYFYSNSILGGATCECKQMVKK